MKYDFEQAITDKINSFKEDIKNDLITKEFNNFLTTVFSLIETGTDFPEMYGLRYVNLHFDDHNDLHIEMKNENENKFLLDFNKRGFTFHDEENSIFVRVDSDKMKLGEEHASIELVFNYKNDIIYVHKTHEHTIRISVYMDAAKKYSGNVMSVENEKYLIPDDVYEIKSTFKTSKYIYEASSVTEEDEIPLSNYYRLDYLRKIGMKYDNEFAKKYDFESYHAYKK